MFFYSRKIDDHNAVQINSDLHWFRFAIGLMKNGIYNGLFQSIIGIIHVTFRLCLSLYLDNFFFYDVCIDIIKNIPDLFPDRAIKSLFKKIIRTFRFFCIKFHKINLRSGNKFIRSFCKHKHTNISYIQARICFIGRFQSQQ